VNIVELVKQILYDNGVKNPDKLFEQKEQQTNAQPILGLPNSAGAGTTQTGSSPIGIEANTGMANSPELSPNLAPIS
jgi:hypothetical protein